MPACGELMMAQPESSTRSSGFTPSEVERAHEPLIRILSASVSGPATSINRATQPSSHLTVTNRTATSERPALMEPDYAEQPAVTSHRLPARLDDSIPSGSDSSE